MVSRRDTRPLDDVPCILKNHELRYKPGCSLRHVEAGHRSTRQVGNCPFAFVSFTSQTRGGWKRWCYGSSHNWEGKAYVNYISCRTLGAAQASAPAPSPFRQSWKLVPSSGPTTIMAMRTGWTTLVVGITCVVLAVSINDAWSKSFAIVNSCGYTVWPGILSSAGSAGLDTTGFALAPGQSRTISVPAGWSGRLWGRTLCSTGADGKFTCITGDCGSGRLDCGGAGAAPPATLAEFTMDGSGGMDFYDVSLVDGYNLPMLVTPQGAGAGGNCAPTGCMVDLNGACPAELRVSSSASANGGVACKSACEAFGSAQYCCSGEYGNPNTCRPSAYSQFFKNACPRAYSYAYDDATSTFTCTGGDTTYTITFCPSTTSVKSGGPNQQPLINDTMVYHAGGQDVGSAVTARPPSTSLVLIGVTLFALADAFY